MSKTTLKFDKVEKIQPECPHFAECGGCAYQDYLYNEQLKAKQKYMMGLLEKNGLAVDMYEGIKPSPMIYGYRNKMEYSFGDYIKGGELTLGLHKSGRFMDILTTDECRIVDSDFNSIVRCTQEYFRSTNISHYNRKTQQGYLRFLVVRKGKNTGEILINLVTTSQEAKDLTEYTDIINGLNFTGKLCGVLHTVSDSPADAILPENMETLFGRDYIYDKIHGLTFKISPFSFFQTNTLGAEVLYDTIKEYAGDIKDKSILDLYCGTGSIGITLAGQAKEVIGVEIVEEAVQAARENARINDIGNCRFFAGDAGKVLKENEMRPDIIVVDPPRPGIGEKTAEEIVGLAAEKIVYVSCNPVSLMDDLKLLKGKYSIKRMANIDMFPHTKHVESVVLMSKILVI